MRTIRNSSRLGGCTWSWGVYLVLGGVPGPGGCTWFWGVYLGPGGCTWSQGVYLVLRGCTWSQGVCTWSRGVYLFPGGVPVPGECTWSWGYLPRYSPPPRGQTDTCKNITFATSLRAVKIQRLDQGLNLDHLLGSVSHANHYTRIFSVLV